MESRDKRLGELGVRGWGWGWGESSEGGGEKQPGEVGRPRSDGGSSPLSLVVICLPLSALPLARGTLASSGSSEHAPKNLC